MSNTLAATNQASLNACRLLGVRIQLHTCVHRTSFKIQLCRLSTDIRATFTSPFDQDQTFGSDLHRKWQSKLQPTCWRYVVHVLVLFWLRVGEIWQFVGDVLAMCHVFMFWLCVGDVFTPRWRCFGYALVCQLRVGDVSVMCW